MGSRGRVAGGEVEARAPKGKKKEKRRLGRAKRAMVLVGSVGRSVSSPHHRSALLSASPSPNPHPPSPTTTSYTRRKACPAAHNPTPRHAEPPTHPDQAVRHHAMFSKAPRFPTRPPDAVPGPNAYDPQEPLAHWKQGIYADHAPTQPRRVSDNGGVAVASLNRVLAPSSQPNLAASTTATTSSVAQKQRQKLESQLSRTAAQLDEQQQRATRFENQANSLATELRLAQQREAKLKAALEKVEKQSARSKDKSAKYAELEERIGELQRVHDESKAKRNTEVQAAVRAVQEGKAAAEKREKELKQREVELKEEVERWKRKAVEMERERERKAAEAQEEERQRSEQEAQRLQAAVEGQREHEATLRDRLHRAEAEATRAMEKWRREADERERLCAQLAQSQHAQDELERRIEELEDELEERERETRCNLGVMARASGDAVARARREADEDRARWQEQAVAARYEAVRMATVVDEMRAQMQELVQVVWQVQEDRDGAKRAAAGAEGDLEALLLERRLDREVDKQMGDEAERETFADDDDDDSGLFGAGPSMSADVVELCQALSDLADQEALTTQLRAEVEELHASLLVVTAERNEATTTLAEVRAQLDAAARRAQEAETQLATAAHLQAQRQAARDDEVERLRTETEQLKHQLRQQVEATKSMATALGCARTAEAACLDQRDRLAEEVEQLSIYQAMYEDLCVEVRHLASRSELAEAESDHLATITAKLLGHSNPAQKIVYLDRVRRELQEAKREVARFEVLLEHQTEKYEKVKEELDRFKALDLPLACRPRTEMVRVSRVRPGESGGREAWSRSVSVQSPAVEMESMPIESTPAKGPEKGQRRKLRPSAVAGPPRCVPRSESLAEIESELDDNFEQQAYPTHHSRLHDHQDVELTLDDLH
ncbi:hypothetical protein ACQY0O_002109 [Thecaphora frezii]